MGHGGKRSLSNLLRGTIEGASGKKRITRNADPKSEPLRVFHFDRTDLCKRIDQAGERFCKHADVYAVDQAMVDLDGDAQLRPIVA